MTFDITLVLIILLVSLVLFITEKIRMDVVSLMVLATLALTGLVTPTQALSGFSNAAVITVWAMFILSEGLTNTGVANIIGQYVLKLAGKTEIRMVFVIMITSGLLSAVMNNIGVAALMLPVVLTVARKVKVAPSRLLMPLAFGSLLGGLTTLIGTPPNLLIANALKENGLEPFRLLDFTPIGITVMIAGTAFVAIFGRLLLPEKDPGKQEDPGGEGQSLREQYALGERTFVLKIPESSPLCGKTLAESHLGRALGLHVIALQRQGQTTLTPGPHTRLQSGDRLLTQGKADPLNELRAWHDLQATNVEKNYGSLFAEDIKLGEGFVHEGSSLVGQSLKQYDFRRQHGLTVLNVTRNRETLERDLANIQIEPGDKFLMQGKDEQFKLIEVLPYVFKNVKIASQNDLEKRRRIRERLFEVRIPEASWLHGKSLVDTRLKQCFDLHVISVCRPGVAEDIILPGPDLILHSGDMLTLHGRKEDLDTVRGLQTLEIQTSEQADAEILESEDVQLVESTLAPGSHFAGKTPAEIQLRNRFSVQLLGIQRAGKAIRSDLGNRRLQFGDALLIMGPAEKLKLLEKDHEFLLLSHIHHKSYLTNKSVLAAAIMIGVLIPVFMGWMPIAITAITGATLMVLTRCLSMEDAYRSIEWRSVFLIAGMLPLGTAIQETGAAALIADGIMHSIGGFGPWAIIAGLYLITAMATTIIPTAALVVLMSPIVIKSCLDMGISPHAGMMAIAMAASASFTSPISHPANVMVMGPGGYRFVDYIKLGAPLALVVFITVMLTLPFFWPF